VEFVSNFYFSRLGGLTAAIQLLGIQVRYLLQTFQCLTCATLPGLRSLPPVNVYAVLIITHH